MCRKCGVAACEDGSRCGYLPNWRVLGSTTDARYGITHLTIGYGKRRIGLTCSEDPRQGDKRS